MCRSTDAASTKAGFLIRPVGHSTPPANIGFPHTVVVSGSEHRARLRPVVPRGAAADLLDLSRDPRGNRSCYRDGLSTTSGLLFGASDRAETSCGRSLLTVAAVAEMCNRRTPPRELERDCPCVANANPTGKTTLLVAKRRAFRDLWTTSGPGLGEVATSVLHVAKHVVAV